MTTSYGKPGQLSIGAAFLLLTCMGVAFTAARLTGPDGYAVLVPILLMGTQASVLGRQAILAAIVGGAGVGAMVVWRHNGGRLEVGWWIVIGVNIAALWSTMTCAVRGRLVLFAASTLVMLVYFAWLAWLARGVA